ncbi:MAG: transketolase [Gammaproteobacteria bacterium]|nr:MAG: transketolase [Gammaproteobacteria bacterium]
MPSRRMLANAIRALSMDAVERARSGHPGAPLGLADIAEVLWNDFLRHNPANPHWWNRDRFVLSNGHASMLLYALLHLSGYDLSIEDLKAFRQLGSRTPGHPEYGHTPGVETTTGPLGQGLANAVGMAIAEKVLAARFNRPGHEIVDHHTYVLMGDGCLMEGISHEACSLAGTLRLGKLIGIYDDNGISIDGEVSGWFTDDTPARFEAYGWHVIRSVDGHDPEAIHAALARAREETERPTLICCRTVIGYGAPTRQGTSAVHGAPLGEEEVARVREAIGWSWPPFEVPDEIYRAWDARERGRALEEEWNGRLAAWAEAFPELAAEFRRRMEGELPEGWTEVARRHLEEAQAKQEKVATRKASLQTLNEIGPALPELIGGSADLAESNLTFWQGARGLSAEDADGNYIYYGVREFAMTAIMNGLSLHGGFIPYGGTFLVFSDYARNAVRMAALMGVRSVLVYTHDSIALGEDGPTHQPVEHAASLRLIPNLHVWRPCDTVETAAAWRAAVERTAGPTALLLTRQGVPAQARDEAALEGIARGGYVLRDCEGEPDVILIATGSEVALAMAAVSALEERGKRTRVVSMPCLEVFEAQEQAWRDAVLPPGPARRVAIEAGSPDPWYRWTGPEGAVIGLDRFGLSAPGDRVYAELGFTVEAVVAAADG